MTTQPELEPDEKQLFRTAVKYSCKDFKWTICTLVLLAISMLFLVVISFKIIPDSKRALVAIVAMICALLFGSVIASLISPLTSKEESQFERILSTLASVVSGFALGSIDKIIIFLKDAIPPPTPEPIEIDFFLLAPLAAFLIGLSSSFLARAAFRSRDENLREVRLRELSEKDNR